MGVAIIDRDRIEAIIRYAHAHPYIPGETAIPGSIPEHVMLCGTYRVVYSMTVEIEAKQRNVWRHLSISCLARDASPNPAIAIELARAFGFRGDPETWATATDDGGRVLIAAQRIL